MEIAYLLGAISPTFVNTMLLIYVDLPEIRKTRSEAIKDKKRAEAIKKFQIEDRGRDRLGG